MALQDDIRRLRQESDEVQRRITEARTSHQQEYRDQFTAGWEAWLEQHYEEQEAPEVVPRTGHAGQPPLYALDPQYVPPDQLPPGNVSPEYDVLTGFLYGHEWLEVTSSNVKAIRYHDTAETLTVEFLNGSVYQYPNVSVDEAMDFATAPSKGRWVWRNLRPRSNYVLIAAGTPPGGRLPKRTKEGRPYGPHFRQAPTYDPSKATRKY